LIVPRAVAERELLASREDVWEFLAQPQHLADWWPGLAAVEPDRRGLAKGARWKVRRGAQPGLLRSANTEETLLILDADRPRFVRARFVGRRLDLELELSAAAIDRTLVRLAVSGPFVLAFRRNLPRVALERLYDLVQTGASL
jgi:uncharacterized protein YndB with AHSA1/START domain